MLAACALSSPVWAQAPAQTIDGDALVRQICAQCHMGGVNRAPINIARTMQTVYDWAKTRAPTWMAQLPGLLSDEELDGVRRRAQGAMRDRMLREELSQLEAHEFIARWSTVEQEAIEG